MSSRISKEQFQQFIAEIQAACEKIGWDIAVPGKEDSKVGLLILGDNTGIMTFIDESVDTDVEFTLYSCMPSLTDDLDLQ